MTGNIKAIADSVGRSIDKADVLLAIWKSAKLTDNDEWKIYNLLKAYRHKLDDLQEGLLIMQTEVRQVKKRAPG